MSLDLADVTKRHPHLQGVKDGMKNLCKMSFNKKLLVIIWI